MAGLKFYRDGCAGCHGEVGKPSQWGATGFYPRAPQFDAEPPLKPDWQMFWIVKHGVRYSGMGAWEYLAFDNDIWKVVTSLSHLEALAAGRGGGVERAATRQLMRDAISSRPQACDSIFHSSPCFANVKVRIPAR